MQSQLQGSEEVLCLEYGNTDFDRCRHLCCKEGKVSNGPKRQRTSEKSKKANFSLPFSGPVRSMQEAYHSNPNYEYAGGRSTAIRAGSDLQVDEDEELPSPKDLLRDVFHSSTPISTTIVANPEDVKAPDEIDDLYGMLTMEDFTGCVEANAY
jgi:hypothetical protein